MVLSRLDGQVGCPHVEKKAKWVPMQLVLGARSNKSIQLFASLNYRLV